VGLSMAYLVAVLLVIALQPLAPVPPLELMTQSNIWLGPFQGLVAGTMGAFFVKAASAAGGGRSRSETAGTTENPPL
jgi:H+/Cl- antiporter ClcA